MGAQSELHSIILSILFILSETIASLVRVDATRCKFEPTGGQWKSRTRYTVAKVNVDRRAMRDLFFSA